MRDLIVSNLNIRPLAVEDLTAGKAIVASTGLFPPEMLDDMTAPFLTRTAPDDLWFVAAQADDLVGLVYCAPERMTDRAWKLLLIAVLESEQGRGVGGELTRRVEAALRERGARILLVETSGLPSFERTRAVYRRLGYVETARIPEFYAPGEDKVVFWKALS